MQQSAGSRANPFEAGVRVYAENRRDRNLAYHVDAKAALEQLRAIDGQAQVHVRFADEPDFALLSDCNVFVGSGFDPSLITKHGQKLKLVHSTSAGVERYVPLDWLPTGSVFTNSSGIHAGKAGEFGLLALLMLNDRLPQHFTKQREHVWNHVLSTSIRGKRVLVYGMGAIGSAIAEKAKLIGLEVWGIRRSEAGVQRAAADRLFGPNALHGLLPDVDFLVLSCPLTPATRRVIGSRELSLLKRGAGIINVARAGLIDHDALTEALVSNHLSGAILDVFETEPLPADSPLWDVPNLVVMPHVAIDDPVDYITRSIAILAGNIKRLRSGLVPTNVVDDTRGY